MKTRILSILFLLASSLAIAQQKSFRSENTATGNTKKKKVKEFVYPSNVVKLNIPSFLFKTVAVQYERKMNRRFSVALGLSYRPKSSFFLYKFMADSASSFGIGPETAEMFRSARYSSLMITPELRYYFKRKAPKGLYISSFLRFKRETNAFTFHYDETNVNPSIAKSAIATVRDNTLGGGLLFGYHLVSKKKFAIDFWFAGPWYGYMSSKITAPLNTNNITSFDRAIIESKLSKITNLDQLDWTSKGIDSRTERGGLGFRMLGINIGYNF